MEEQQDTITRGTKVSMEILITLIGLVVVIVGSFVRAEMNNSVAKKEIAELRGQFSAYAESTAHELKLANATLNEIKVEARIKNELDKIRTGDRWTASMQEDFQEIWYGIVKEYHPDIARGNIPSVEDIQRKHLDRMYGDLN